MKNLFLIAIIVLGFSGISFGQASATATASATIVTPISISNAGDMDFGTVAVQTATGGTVILTTAGGRSTGGAGGVTLPAFNLGTITAAHFAVVGEKDYTYSITLPSSDVTVISGANNMIVNAFTSTPTATAGKLNGTGTQTIDVGATLNVKPAQAAGTYITTTPFTVTVNYN